jgi:hypothetical protein
VSRLLSFIVREESNMIRGTVLACVVAVLASAVLADEEKGPQDKLPKAVTEAVKKKFPKGKVVSVYPVYCRFDGVTKTLHGLKIKDGETTADVWVWPTGEIDRIAKEITTKDLPIDAKTVLDDKYPKATIKLVRESIEGKDLKELTYLVYLVTKEHKDQSVNILFDPKGKVLSVSVIFETVSGP